MSETILEQSVRSALGSISEIKPLSNEERKATRESLNKRMQALAKRTQKYDAFRNNLPQELLHRPCTI